MTAVKTLAIGALVIGAAARTASAGPYDSTSLNWTGWNAGTGLIVNNNGGPTNPFQFTAPVAAPVAAPAPAAANASMALMSAVAVANTAPSIATASMASMSSPAASAPSGPTYDAFINLGSAPFPDAANLTSGVPQGWASSNSPDLLNIFGGHPTAQQQADFNNTVLQRVEQTFALSGVPVNLTTDPTANASHTLSVVSNTESSWGPLLGLTNIGGNGFSFINDDAKWAKSIDQLEWVVAHNVSHELMLAFGVGENYDKSGNYIDASMANLNMLLNANATFSAGAADALNAARAQGGSASTGGAFAQEVGPQPVPEPATIAVWTIAAAGLVLARRHRSRRQTA